MRKGKKIVGVLFLGFANQRPLSLFHYRLLTLFEVRISTVESIVLSGGQIGVKIYFKVFEESYIIAAQDLPRNLDKHRPSDKQVKRDFFFLH